MKNAVGIWQSISRKDNETDMNTDFAQGSIHFIFSVIPDTTAYTTPHPQQSLKAKLRQQQHQKR